MSELDEIALALSKLQGEVLNATADARGHNYNYAKLDQVLDIARPLMSKYELSLTQMPTTNEDGKIGLTSLLMHSSGQHIQSFYELPIEANARMSTAQACGSVITYMRRYALAAILGIAQTDEDAAAQEIKKAKASIGDEELKAGIKSIQECKTMDELKAAFESLTPQLRTKLVHEKDIKKGELSATQR